MEEYVLDALVASVESVVPGLGSLAGMLAVLADELAGTGPAAMTLDAMEQLVVVRGRELLRAVFQHGLDAGAGGEVRLAEVTGADAVARTRAERDHSRILVTTVGPVRVRRIAYRAKVKGVPALFPRDLVLNLPLCCYSWRLQQLAVMFARDGAYELAREFLQAATGITIGRRQLEEMAAAAASGVPAFYAVPACGQPGKPADRDGDEPGPLGLSADGKGVAMRPESRRRRAKAPGKRVKRFQNRPGTGEKGHKRIAEVACVFDGVCQISGVRAFWFPRLSLFKEFCRTPCLWRVLSYLSSRLA